ncbi:hypothetical protein [Methylocystis sp.]|uniref:hypothetical protein n=1 Tax=Methylocystis sp. TaxID=1911079 RepID=UPI003DA3ED36
MQNRYAGDIGDYIKISLLQHLGVGRRLGVAWYLFRDEEHNTDGRHIAYLCAPEQWRHLNPHLFDLMAEITSKKRAVSGLHQAFKAGTLFAAESLPVDRMSGIERCKMRSAWFSRTVKALEGAEIVFMDPDNGLTTDDEQRRRTPSFGKQIPLNEVLALCEGRTAIVYHHNSRFKGGHDAEVDHWRRAIGRPTIAVRANAFSCRTFFVINADAEIAERTRDFCEKWKNNKIRLHRSAFA